MPHSRAFAGKFFLLSVRSLSWTSPVFLAVGGSVAKPASLAACARPAFAPPPYIPARARVRKIGVDIVYAE